MTFLIFIFGLMLAVGLYFISADLLKLPTLAAEKAMLSAQRSEKKQSQTIETILNGFAVKLSRVLPMNEYKKDKLTKTLSAAGMEMSPELYMSEALVKAGAIALLALPCLALAPLLSPIALFLAILIYLKEIRKADEAMSKKRGKIEAELPRLSATLEQELKASRDVLSILENYKKSAGVELALELDILTADMRSSSYEAALVRFEGRIGSAMLSDIVRGLIGVLRGDDGGTYFQMLSHDMKQLELQRLKAEANKIPGRIRKYSFIMLMCFTLTYAVVIVSEILKSLGTMF